ncbi:MAG: glycosyltransferase family 2 protein [Bacteroidetes bacterium]|nr:glycosyltransferase family 2 protein [Bacteroidota bacterium]
MYLTLERLNKIMSGISIVIPVYNEGKEILSTIDKVNEIMLTLRLDYELIIVNDGSNDKTGQYLAQRENNCKVCEHVNNRGYGAALKTGIKNEKNEIICITDADGTYPNDKIPHLFDQLINNDLDMVIGARTGRHVKIPFVRKPAKWAIGKLANWVTNQSIPDINSGLRIFKKSSFSPFQNIVPNGFSFTTTITLGMLSGGYRVEFTPIDYFQRSGKSKIKPIRDTLKFTKLILRIGLYFAPLKIFMPISTGLFLFAIGWGVFTKFVLGELADVTSLIIAMTGFQIAVIALIAELINHRLPNKYIK